MNNFYPFRRIQTTPDKGQETPPPIPTGPKHSSEISSEEVVGLGPMLGGLGRFPDNLFVITLPGGYYAANHLTLDGDSDGDLIANALATFPTTGDAYLYLINTYKNQSVAITPMRFEQARQIAKDNPKLDSLAVWSNGLVQDVMYVGGSSDHS